jgi:hypothetical protein
MSFDGTDDFAYLSSPSAALTPATTITVSAWINGDDYVYSGNKRAYVVAEEPRGAWGDGRGYNISISDTTAHASFQIGSTGDSSWHTATGSTTLSTGTWYHIVGTYDGTTIKVYVNGRLDGSTSYSSTINYTDNGTQGPNPQTLYIGAQHSATNSSNTTTGDMYFFDGLVDDVKVFLYTLTESQIKSLYNNGSVAFTQ